LNIAPAGNFRGGGKYAVPAHSWPGGRLLMCPANPDAQAWRSAGETALCKVTQGCQCYLHYSSALQSDELLLHCLKKHTTISEPG